MSAAWVLLAWMALGGGAGCRGDGEGTTPPAAGAQTQAPAQVQGQAQVQAQTRATERDMDGLTGAPWKGTLRYLDYTSGKWTTIRSSLVVQRQSGTGPAAWDVRIGYTDEPDKDGGETFGLPGGGAEFLGATVVSRVELPDGSVRIVTESQSEDDRRPALLRKEFKISARRCTVKKLVRWNGSAEFFERHTYDWSR